MQFKVKKSAAGLEFWRSSGGKPAGAPGRRPSAAFTLVEVLIAAAIVGLVFGGIINCYIQSGLRLEWSGYSLAAQSLASEVLEQSRAATWDPAESTPINNLTNLNLMSVSYSTTTQTYTGYSTSILDVPYSGTNSVMATNYVMVQMLNVNSNTQVQVQFIRVDTVWPFFIRKQNLYFTNTVCTMVGPDDRQI